MITFLFYKHIEHPTSPDGNDELATAVGQYVLGEISLGKAAESAGMSRWEFEELLEETGFAALYGPRTNDDLRDESMSYEISKSR